MVLSSPKRGRPSIALTEAQPDKLFALYSRTIQKDNVDHASAELDAPAVWMVDTRQTGLHCCTAWTKNRIVSNATEKETFKPV